jgi:N-acetylglucosamine malate deacetylase 1
MLAPSGTALVVAAHPDDEVLGCGGTMAKLTAAGWRTHLLLLAEGVTSRDITRDRQKRSQDLEDLRSATFAAHKVLGTSSVVTHDFPDNRMDSVDLLDVVKIVEERIDKVQPSRIYTHHSGDVNIDHRVTHEAVQAACRPQPGNYIRELFFFEITSSTEWRSSGGSGSFQPALFNDISEYLELKTKALRCYEGEMRKWPHPRSYAGVTALAHWRGATSGCNAAEAFVVGRIIE